jgi:drug/metabolite transporter (DMT)-like permease
MRDNQPLMTQSLLSEGAMSNWLRVAPFLFLILWSGGFVFVKIGLAYADPLTFLALRYVCAVAILSVLFLLIRPPIPAGSKSWLHLIVIGILLQAGYFPFTYLGLKYGMSAGAVALITAQQPVLVGLLAPAIAGEKVDAIRWLGLVLGVAGAGLVIVARSSIGAASPSGLLFAIAALLSITSGILWQKRFPTLSHPVLANLVQYAVGFAITAPLAFFLEPMRVDWAPSLFGSLAYLVLGNSIVAISLLLAMVKYGEASKVSALFFLVPPTTAFIAFVLLQETIPTLALPGFALSAYGIYLVMRPQNQRVTSRERGSGWPHRRILARLGWPLPPHAAKIGAGRGMSFASFRKFWAVAANRNSSLAPLGQRRRNRSSLRMRLK